MIVSQHFLLTAAARSLSLGQVLRLSDEEAHAKFVAFRWSDNGGQPYCPHCGNIEVYRYRSRPIWRCKGCNKQFSVTSGTIFHKLREAMGSQVHNPDEPDLSGTVEVDGAYFGGHVKPENRKTDRIDRRLAEEQTGKRQVVVVAREIMGRTLPFIVPRESDAVPLIRQHVASGTIIHADESSAWERLHASYDTRRVNHSQEYATDDGTNVNQAESFFSRLRRAEIGQHHRISGRYLYQYANEMAWREDNRRLPNGMNWRLVTGAALRHAKS